MAHQRQERVDHGPALAELNRLLEDPKFNASDRNKRFLKYISDEYFAGRGDSVKAFTIAVDVFGRSSDFDPQNDAIVRIEANRLRAALKKYYDEHGGDITISIEKGKYQPLFIQKSNPVNRAAVKPLKGRYIIASLVLGVVALAALAAWLVTRDDVVYSLRPSVALHIQVDDKITGDIYKNFRPLLISSLSKFDTLTIEEAETPAAIPASSGFFGSKISILQRRYILSVDLQSVKEKLHVQWHVIDSHNKYLQSGSIDDYGMAFVVSKLSNRIAGYGGAISSIEAQADFREPTLGNGCVQRAIVAAGAHLNRERENSAACLEETMKLSPNNQDALSVMSAQIVSFTPFDPDPARKEKAVSFARAATIIAPESSRSSFTLAMALYQNQQLQAAAKEGLRSISLNPDEYVFKGYVGWLLYLSGRRAEGVALAKEVEQHFDNFAQFDAGSTLLLDAYLKGNYQLVVDWIGERTNKLSYLANVILLASYGQLKRSEEASRMMVNFEQSYPGFKRKFAYDMRARSIGDDIVTALTQGLLKVNTNFFSESGSSL